MKILGIETSCDETAVAVVDDARAILAQRLRSQHQAHQPFGGVVPEIAARQHIEHLDSMIRDTLKDAGLTLQDMDGIAATAGPGLIGGVMVGAVTGKALAAALGKPFIAVNHLEGHALTARLTDNVPFPYLLLLVSGGHCQLLVAQGVGNYKELGSTVDDALGEAFDKTAKLLGLGYPGGPQVERMAAQGNASRFTFSVPLKGRKGCDFSFSGLKTAVRQQVETLGGRDKLSDMDKADICAAFQRVAGEALEDRVGHALLYYRQHYPDGKHLVVAGGVAANQYLCNVLSGLARKHGVMLVSPPPALCTDNAAMIAWVGVERLLKGISDPLDAEPRPRWPLTELQPV